MSGLVCGCVYVVCRVLCVVVVVVQSKTILKWPGTPQNREEKRRKRQDAKTQRRCKGELRWISGDTLVNTKQNDVATYQKVVPKFGHRHK